ncbi:amylo-alpha-1,6-glucosidase [Parvibaculum sp.]|jgi:glycogen debranching enzyme|uniref:amylo-alpha-1,6-glucosidase n=1 Tax=Parvibaculum sp. TaxID=2024848 RepID=UPI000C5CB2EB|nr:amylo-alpha-1,6-glucosidase [Parvibaculum sp.]MAM95479.1 amylo-alpha-1,6-glucosidase [Parvibaculum sp.]|tara:strand:- start:4819 stop:7023 length:2205 start_codon:yes stop_codon:yes gene_type:complete
MNERDREASPFSDQAEGILAPIQFYIPATTSLLERRPRTLKHGDTFGVFDHYGNIVPGKGSPEGIYHKDTRHLSDLRIFVNGARPLLLSSTIQDNNALLRVDLTNPDFVEDGGIEFPRDVIHIARSWFLWNGIGYERFGIRNFDVHSHEIEFSIKFAADFADMFEIRGNRRERRGKISHEISRDGVTFIYKGLDDIVRRTVLRFDPQPRSVDDRSAHFRFDLMPQERMSFFLSVACEQGSAAPERPAHFLPALREARRALRRSTKRAASVESSNEVFNEVLCRSMADIYMLLTDTECGPYPYAGIPWFSTAFGRDGIVTALQMLWVDPAIAKGVLKFLAATQATEIDPQSEAEPGKILHETRSGEMARLGEVPFALYYGSIDSTPLFVVLAARYLERTGDRQTLSQLWPNIEAALVWIDEYGDRDGDGFVEYERAGDGGLVNQGWKDSVDSVFHADGTWPEGSIALCEVQGYVYEAKRCAADIAETLGYSARAAKLRLEAESLRARFEDVFWCEQIGTYALALDGRKRPCKVRSSNAGHLLFSGIASPERAQRVADQLLGSSFFTGWGVRTIASTEARYNPMSYHNGSIWPHDNALIGLGFARYGLKQHVLRLFSGLFGAAVYMDMRRLPELFCGFRKAPGKGPTFYPVACSPQAWSSAAPFAFLQASLGLELCCSGEKVLFRQPRLPDFIDEVVISSLTIGQSEIDILLRRYGTDVSVNVLRRTGRADVAVTL